MNAKSKALKISMSKKDFVKEHKHLTKVLRTGKGLREEYRKQEKELEEKE